MFPLGDPILEVPSHLSVAPMPINVGVLAVCWSGGAGKSRAERDMVESGNPSKRCLMEGSIREVFENIKRTALTEILTPFNTAKCCASSMGQLQVNPVRTRPVKDSAQTPKYMKHHTDEQ